jgi:hypothetical protein
MTPRHRFRPTDSWLLEDRLAPSHMGVTAQVATLATPAQQVLGTALGTYATTSKLGVDTIGAVTTLSGSSKIPGVGTVTVSGALSNSLVVPNHGGTTSGSVVVAATNRSGSLTLALTGVYGNLAPTSRSTLTLSFTVVKATGKFAFELGGKGTASLSLQETKAAKPGVGKQVTTTSGKFTVIIAV